jgi:hypothetical protein
MPTWVRTHGGARQSDGTPSCVAKAEVASDGEIFRAVCWIDRGDPISGSSYRVGFEYLSAATAQAAADYFVRRSAPEHKCSSACTAWAQVVP